jgi:hypothetical protein
MVAQIQRLPFTLHALVAEAKRRARRRRIFLMVAVIALAGGTAAAVYATHASGRAESSPATVHYWPGGLRGCGRCHVQRYNAPPASVFASSRGAAWVVGWSQRLMWRWDGRAWRSVPRPKTGALPLSVAPIGPSDAWAVGGSTLEHWSGTRWTVVHLPAGLVRRSALEAVSASGPRSVWAGAGFEVAKGHRPAGEFLLHWDGVAWRKQRIPLPVPTGVAKVAATGPSGVWVVPVNAWTQRQGDFEYWNGSVWRSVPAPFGLTDPVSGFSATSGDDAWAVGSRAKIKRGGVFGDPVPLAAHWDGTAWRFTPVPSPPGHTVSVLSDVAAVSPTDAWAIGQSQRVTPNRAFAPKLFMLHWDGSSWTIVPGSAHSSLYDSTPKISAASDGTVLAIGNCGNDNITLSWNGSRWTVVPHPPDQRWQARHPARFGRLTSCASAASGR